MARDRAQASAPGRRGRPPVESGALFVYGTLRFPEVLTALLGRVPVREPSAAGCRRVAALRGRIYPGLVTADTTAHGFLLTGLTAAERRVLDAFEGVEYRLDRLDLVDGRRVWAYAWLAGDEVEDADWSPTDFAARHLPAYAERCAAWRRLFADRERSG